MMELCRKYRKSVNFFALVLLVFSSFVSFVPTSKAANSLEYNWLVCADGTFSNTEECSSGILFHIYDSGTAYYTLRYLIDGKTAYCLEPGVHVGENAAGYIPGSWTSSNLNFSKDKIRELELIAYFGYGYGNHTSSLWYAATADLIWRTINPDIGITYRIGGRDGSIVNFDSYQQEIKKLINNFKKEPSFAGQTIKGKLNKGVTLTDKNGVLNNWNVTSNSDCDITTSGNKLTVTCDEAQQVNLQMSRKGLENNASVIYTYTGYQTLGVLNLNTPISSSATVSLVDVKYPVITKDVSQDKVEIGEEFNYTFEYTIDKLEDGIYYDSFLIEDQFEPVLKMDDVSQVKIYNEEEKDVTDLFDISVADNKLEIRVKNLKDNNFYGHTYKVEVTTELLSNSDLNNYADNVNSNGSGTYTIPNEVTLTVDGNISKDSVPVTYEVVIVEVPETAARISLIVVGVGVSLIAAGFIGYCIVLKRKKSL